MERRCNILVEYKDGSFQWIRDALESDVCKMPDVARIKSYCNSEFRVGTERWRTGESEFEKVVISRPAHASCTGRGRISSCNTSTPSRPA
jgi:hypothetical protein